MGGEALAVGGGGTPDLTRIRRILEELSRLEALENQRPQMWEVEVEEKGKEASLRSDIHTFNVSEVILCK